MPLAVTIIRRGLVSSTTCAIRKPMRLIQFLDPHGRVRLGRVDGAGTTGTVMSRPSSTYELALAAVAGGVTLENLLSSESWDADALYADLLASGRMLPPLTHPDPAHCHVSGTGLTHLGSAATRDAMHL